MSGGMSPVSIDFSAEIAERQEKRRSAAIDKLVAAGRFYAVFMAERVTGPEFDQILSALPDEMVNMVDYLCGPPIVAEMLDQIVRALRIIHQNGALDPLDVLRQVVTVPEQVFRQAETELLLSCLLPLATENAENTGKTA